jgi:hypothetical protein
MLLGSPMMSSESTLHIKDVSSIQTREGLGFFQAPILKDTNQLAHAFLTRLGGVSQPPFDTLNLGFNTGDRASSVSKNREIVTRAFELPDSALTTVRQVHGDRVFIVDASSPDDLSKTPCDAIITDRPGIALGVLTADCVPILAFDPEGPSIAAIHVGWKGTALDLPGKVVAVMARRFGVYPENLRAAIGPSIGPCCYEVDEAVHAAFLRRGNLWKNWAHDSGEGRWQLNLAKANRDLLRAAGLHETNIVSIDLCSCCERALFFSFRREKGATGRQISWIMLK